MTSRACARAPINGLATKPTPLVPHPSELQPPDHITVLRPPYYIVVLLLFIAGDRATP